MPAKPGPPSRVQSTFFRERSFDHNRSTSNWDLLIEDGVSIWAMCLGGEGGLALDFHARYDGM
jgi:hypothetical protein